MAPTVSKSFAESITTTSKAPLVKNNLSSVPPVYSIIEDMIDLRS